MNELFPPPLTFFIFCSFLRGRRRGEHHDLRRHRRVPRDGAAGAVAAEVRPGRPGCGGGGRVVELRVTPVHRHRPVKIIDRPKFDIKYLPIKFRHKIFADQIST